MTRHPPGRYQDYRQDVNPSYSHSQYGGEANAFYGQSQDWTPPPPPPPPQLQQQYSQYEAESTGPQSYYGLNDQPYQQYSSQSDGNQQYGLHSEAPYVQPLMNERAGYSPSIAYASQYSPPEQYPQFGQQYGPGEDSDVDAFKSHFEKPHGPIDADTPVPNPGPPSGPENDRGLMGALAGGAAGAFGGHKVSHGFLGAIGGAAAGSMMEDAWKKHAKEKQHEQQTRYQHQPGAEDVVYAGNFHASSQNVHLEDGSILVAECREVNGAPRWSRLDLNECFTNEGGHLKWEHGGNFAASSRHIRLIDDGNGLEAELGDGRGGWLVNKAWLPERITNNNGRLQFLA